MNFKFLSKAYLKFEHIPFKINTDDPLSGVEGRLSFENGYGVSVVRKKGSYGYDEGLFELAVLDENGWITSCTPITSDVVGWLSEENVTNIMKQIQDL